MNVIIRPLVLWLILNMFYSFFTIHMQITYCIVVVFVVGCLLNCLYFIYDAAQFSHCRSNRKAMNRNWCNQKANPALKTKAGNK